MRFPAVITGTVLAVIAVVCVVGDVAPATAPPITAPVTACVPALQVRIDATPPGGTLDLTGCEYNAGATIHSPMTLKGAVIRPTQGSPALTVTADDVTLDGVRISGVQSLAYRFDEMGVRVVGDSSKPVRGLIVRDSVIGELGGFGLYLEHVVDLRVEGNEIHDVVYAGIMILSAQRGVIAGNVIQRIGVHGSEANSGNAYGVALTTAPRSSATSDFVVSGNSVEDVPSWHALDTHGGQRIVFADNTVRRSPRALFITTDESDRSPGAITVTGNQFESPAPVTANLVVVTTHAATDVVVTGNSAHGWGGAPFLQDFEEMSRRLVVSGNIVGP